MGVIASASLDRIQGGDVAHPGYTLLHTLVRMRASGFLYSFSDTCNCPVGVIAVGIAEDVLADPQPIASLSRSLRSADRLAQPIGRRLSKYCAPKTPLHVGRVMGR